MSFCKHFLSMWKIGSYMTEEKRNNWDLDRKMLNPKVKFPLSIHMCLSCTAASTERGKDLWTVCILHLNCMMLLFLGFHSAFFQMSSGKNSLVCCFFQDLYLPCVGSTQNLLLNLQKVSWSDKTACVVFPKEEKSAFLFQFSDFISMVSQISQSISHWHQQHYWFL